MTTPGAVSARRTRVRSSPSLQVDELLSLTITWRNNGRLPVPSSCMVKTSVSHLRLGRLRSGRVVRLRSAMARTVPQLAKLTSICTAPADPVRV